MLYPVELRAEGALYGVVRSCTLGDGILGQLIGEMMAKKRGVRWPNILSLGWLAPLTENNTDIYSSNCGINLS